MRPVTVSLSSAASSATIPVDWRITPFELSLAVVLTDTPNLTYKAQVTYDDVQDSSVTPVWLDHADIVSKTANFAGSVISPVKAVRLTVTAYTAGTATMTILQAG